MRMRIPVLMAFVAVLVLVVPSGNTVIHVNPGTGNAAVYFSISQNISISFPAPDNYTHALVREIENMTPLMINETAISSAEPFYGMLNAEVKESGSYMYVTNLSYLSNYSFTATNYSVNLSSTVAFSYLVNGIIQNGTMNLGWVNAFPSVYYAPEISLLPGPVTAALNFSWEESVSQVGISWMKEYYNGTSDKTKFTGLETVSGTAYSNSTIRVAVSGVHETTVMVPGKVNVEGNSLTFFRTVQINFTEIVLISAAVSVAIMIAVLLYYRKALNGN